MVDFLAMELMTQDGTVQYRGKYVMYWIIGIQWEYHVVYYIYI